MDDRNDYTEMATSPVSQDLAAADLGPAYVACEAGASLVLAPRIDGIVDLDSAVRVSGLARELWDRRVAGASPEQLAAWVASQHDLESARAATDVRAFLADLDRRGFGSVAAGTQSTVPPAQADPSPPGDEFATTLSPAAVVELARSILDGGDRFSFRAQGLSMRPQLPHGSVLEVAPCAFADLRVGDIALYSAGEHRLVAHRVVGRKGDRLLARGDSAARLDLVRPEDFLGAVVARLESSGGTRRRLPLDRGPRRFAGLLGGLWHRTWTGVVRCVVVAPLRRFTLLRRVLGWPMALGSRVLRALERRLTRLRYRVDVGRAALLTPAEKDADRLRLYESKLVQQFTGLDENLDAGLTLIEEVLLNRHQPTPGSALVLGCGPGRECVALARRGFEVTGLDREPGMLELARALVRREGVEVRFVVGEAADFDLADQTFATVFVFSGLYNMLLPRSRRVDLLRASYRHLEPGGQLMLTFLSDYVPPGSAPSPEVRGVWNGINPTHQEGDLYLFNEAIHVFPHPDRFETEAREAGFEVEELFRDQRAYDRATRQVRGYAVLVRPS